MRVIIAACLIVAHSALAGAAPLVLDVVNATVTEEVGVSEQAAGLSITLSPASAMTFGDFTAANLGKTVELRMEGKPVLTATIREAIYGGRVRIGGSGFTRAELKDIANRVPNGGIRMEAEVVAP